MEEIEKLDSNVINRGGEYAAEQKVEAKLDKKGSKKK